MRKPLLGWLMVSLTVLLPTSVPSVAQTPTASAPKKHVRILATGGTIAGSGGGASASYRPGVVSVEDLIAALPGVDRIAAISAEQVANIGSYDVDETLWRKLLSRVEAGLSDPNISGIVITHGTDTIEETAFFLSLALPSAKPVVLVGSMRPGGTLGADGPQNLMDAIRVASANDARGHGVMVVMNDTIYDAATVTKVEVHRVDAFAAPARGPVGQVLGPIPVFFSSGASSSRAFALSEAPLPTVRIVYAYAGLTGDDIRAAGKDANGLVIAGVGAGNFSKGARQAVRELTSRGVPVVRTARQGSGDIWREDAQAGDRSDEALGTIAGRELPPAKARVLLALALQKQRTRTELQSLFDRYGTGKH
jgi:L-asparaginase